MARSIRPSAESTIQVKITLKNASPIWPNPTATPTAAVIQMPAAVVRSLDLALFAQLENGARSDETDAGCETLDYTRQITHRHSCRRPPEDEKRAAHRGEHMRAQTRRLSCLLPLNTYNRAKEHRREQANDHPFKLRPVGDATCQFFEKQFMR